MSCCLFCNQPEEILGADVEFICGSCTQLLLDTEPKERVRAYRKAVECEYVNKAKAIKMFLSEGIVNGDQQETGKVRSNLERERPLRASRSSRHQLRS